MFGDIKDLNLVPIFGMIFAGWLFYLKFREKQIKNQEKIGDIAPWIHNLINLSENAGLVFDIDTQSF